VGDLIGDVAPIRELVTDDDPHGLTDAFLYGVSLNKIARQIDTVGNLHVLPSGSDQVVQEEILRNERWRRLASGFHEAGALLLIATPALSLIGAVGAALTLGVRGAGALSALLVLPLYVPVLVFGAGAVSASAAGANEAAHLSLLGAMALAALVFAPWATAAALKIALE